VSNGLAVVGGVMVLLFAVRAVLVAVVRDGGGVAGFITRDLAGDLGRLGGLPIEVLGEVTRAGEAGLAAGKRLGEVAGQAVKKGLGGLLGREE
jgi:hypothetical protein